MLFWIVYVGFMVCACGFFLWSLRRYLAPLSAAGEAPAGLQDIDPRLIALEAQFIVAPRLALREARVLLQTYEASAAAVVRLEVDALLELIERGRLLERERPA